MSDFFDDDFFYEFKKLAFRDGGGMLVSLVLILFAFSSFTISGFLATAIAVTSSFAIGHLSIAFVIPTILKVSILVVAGILDLFSRGKNSKENTKKVETDKSRKQDNNLTIPSIKKDVKTKNDISVKNKTNDLKKEKSR